MGKRSLRMKFCLVFFHDWKIVKVFNYMHVGPLSYTESFKIVKVCKKCSKIKSHSFHKCGYAYIEDFSLDEKVKTEN